MSERDTDIESRILHNVALPINRLPTEIFLMIITFTGSPSWRIPYPWMHLLWVCHYWRSVILNNPMFWKVIVTRHAQDLHHPFIKEIIIRSRPIPLKIIAYPSFRHIYTLAPDAHRVETLYLRRDDEAHIPMSNVILFFPFLKKIIYESSNIRTDIPLVPLPHLRGLRVSIESLGNLVIPAHFPALWWLHLAYDDTTIPLIPLLEALQRLPSLRILYLYSAKMLDMTATAFAMFTSPIITFHQLEALWTGSAVLQLITAPKLSYLDVSGYPADFYTEDYNHFCGFDFSTITHLRADMAYSDDDYSYILGKSNPNDSEVISYSTFNERCFFTENSLFHEIPTSYPHEFRITFYYSENHLSHLQTPPITIFPFTACLKKANNSVVEIILDNSTPWDSIYEGKDSFLNAMRTTTARHLVLLSGNFSTLCEYLSDRTICPRLEKLTYYSPSDLDRDSDDVLEAVPKLVAGGSIRNLIIAMEDFLPIRPEVDLQSFERIGLRFIQTEWEVSNRFNVF